MANYHFDGSSMSPDTLSSYKWRLRFDLDVLQRCLTVVLLALILRGAVCFLPECLGFWVETWVVELWITVGMILAVLKSCAQLESKGKTVLITGCDTGFGLVLAKHLHSLGFTVFAGCLLKESGGPGAKELEAIDKERMHVIQLDVTKNEDWDKAYEYIYKHAEGNLWGIVNNAGWATYGEVEWVSMATFDKILQINLLGVIRGVKKMLPLIRRAKGGRVVSITSGLTRYAVPSRNRGRVVNIATCLAKYSVPSRSPYVVSKYALEGFSDCLRYEMEPFGVKVSVLEPGNFIAATNIFNHNFVKQQANQMWEHDMSEEVQAAYGYRYFEKRVQIMSSYMNTGITDVTPVIEAYTNALLDAWPQKRYQPMNAAFKWRTFVATHLPEVFYDLFFIEYALPARKEPKPQVN